MAETGEKYTVARRMVIAGGDHDRPPAVLRVYLNPHVDLALTGDAGRAYDAADERGRREIAGRLLTDAIAAGSIVTDHQVRADGEADDDAILAAVRRSMDRAVGVSDVAVE
jgi:hypothetical protein